MSGDGPPSTDAFRVGGTVEIIAHRGFSAAAPENTLTAMEAAIRAGAHAIEFDVQPTGDGAAVVLHDDTLDRTTDGTGPVRGRTLDELASLDAGRWFSDDFAGEPLPSFAAALTRIGDRVGRIYAELKGPWQPEPLRRALEDVRSTGASDRTVFIAIEWGVLDLLRAERPDVPIGYVVDKEHRVKEALARAAEDPTSLLDFRAAILLEAPDVAERAAAQGTELAVWTVDDPDEARRVFELGVPRITTNRVDALVRWSAGL